MLGSRSRRQAAPQNWSRIVGFRGIDPSVVMMMTESSERDGCTDPDR